MFRIAALAVGADKDILVDHDFVARGRIGQVRPYIDGLIKGLAKHGRKLGTDFVIDYRERAPHELAHALAALKEAHLVFPMSTSALQAAKHAAGHKPTVFPSISDHAADGYPQGGNATGVNAMRTQTAGTCLERFKAAVPGLRTIIGLHKPDYGPAHRAHNDLHAAAKKTKVNYESSTVRSRHDIAEAINRMPHRDLGKPAEIGIQVLPDDLCLGAAPTLIELAHKRGIPTFFPVTDWVKKDGPSALGGYGIPQRVCGEMAAEYVDKILWGGAHPRDLPVKNGTGFEWVISRNAAKALKIDVPSGIEAEII